MHNKDDGLGEGDHFVALSTIAHGALDELFKEELRKVLRNILDPNTEATGVREINVKLKMWPNAERRVGDVEYSVSSKVAPTKRGNTTFYFARRRGEPVAVESDPRQADLFDKPDIRPVTSNDDEGKKGA
jgi:hypothetical protein